MKKIAFIIMTVLLIVLIYVLNLDRKVFFFVIGDSIALGKSDNNVVTNYNDYIKNSLEKDKRLEKYVNEYTTTDLRINDVINDINNNKKISTNNKTYNIKNLLIKADLVTISINNEDVLSKLNNNYTVKELYTWADELAKDYETMLMTIRSYCKEKIFVIGYYYPNITENSSNKISIISYLNDTFKEISSLYKVEYINTAELFIENNSFLDKYYPTELGQEQISKQVLLKFNT